MELLAQISHKHVHILLADPIPTALMQHPQMSEHPPWHLLLDLLPQIIDYIQLRYHLYLNPVHTMLLNNQQTLNNSLQELLIFLTVDYDVLKTGVEVERIFGKGETLGVVMEEKEGGMGGQAEGGLQGVVLDLGQGQRVGCGVEGALDRQPDEYAHFWGRQQEQIQTVAVGWYYQSKMVNNYQLFSTGIIIMIARALMLAGAGLWSAALLIHRKSKFYMSLFDTLKQCTKYHMDYVEKVTDIPVNTPVVLYGAPETPQNQQPIIASSFIRKKQGEEDRLWMMKLSNNFILKTVDNQPIQVQNTSSNQILAYNLPRTQRQLSTTSHQERAIVAGSKICVYGQLRPGTPAKFTPQMVIGNQHETLLQFLDKKIIAYGRWVRVLGVMGAVAFGGHAGYVRWGQGRGDVEAEIEQFGGAK